MSNIAENIEGLPFYDYVVEKWNDYAGDHFQTKDPYSEELPGGKTRKRKLPDYCTKEEQKTFKRIQKKAWSHDKCFMGCYPVDCGIGYAPIVSLIPAIGPILMYAVHSRLIHYADQQYHLGSKTVAKLEANILFDLLITLPPIIGSLLSFLNGCSTRNAAIIYNAVAKRAYQASHGNTHAGDDVDVVDWPPSSTQEPVYHQQGQQQQMQSKRQPPAVPPRSTQSKNKFDRIASSFDYQNPQRPQQAKHASTTRHGGQEKGIYH